MAGPHLEEAMLSMSGVRSGTRMVECEYQADSWSRVRRAVLVIQKRADELLPSCFWLITSWSCAEYRPEDLLRHYRTRGIAEGIMGELMNVLNPALSSTSRPKSHYRDQIPQKKIPRWRLLRSKPGAPAPESACVPNNTRVATDDAERHKDWLEH
jgi:hypothetical protein